MAEPREASRWVEPRKGARPPPNPRPPPPPALGTYLQVVPRCRLSIPQRVTCSGAASVPPHAGRKFSTYIAHSNDRCSCSRWAGRNVTAALSNGHGPSAGVVGVALSCLNNTTWSRVCRHGPCYVGGCIDHGLPRGGIGPRGPSLRLRSSRESCCGYYEAMLQSSCCPGRVM